MTTYIVGPSVVHLTGHSTSSRPGARIEHDFSVDGPDGEHGPAREAALLACGALSIASSEVKPQDVAATATTVDQPGPRRVAPIMI